VTEAAASVSEWSRQRRPLRLSSTRPPSRQPFAPDRWLEEHGDVLFRYACLRVRDAHIAEDVVQETLLAAWRGRHTFAGRSSERTWLVGILKHRLVDHWRKNRRLVYASDLSPDGEPLDDVIGETHSRSAISPDCLEPDIVLEQRQFWRALFDCIAVLPRVQARAFTLCELEGLSSAEVCEALDMAPPNLWVTLHRARTRLRKILEDRGFQYRETDR
jgi:RNA polymerase sigma-70 factor (ECF subfamily)